MKKLILSILALSFVVPTFALDSFNTVSSGNWVYSHINSVNGMEDYVNSRNSSSASCSLYLYPSVSGVIEEVQVNFIQGFNPSASYTLSDSASSLEYVYGYDSSNDVVYSYDYFSNGNGVSFNSTTTNISDIGTFINGTSAIATIDNNINTYTEDTHTTRTPLNDNSIKYFRVSSQAKIVYFNDENSLLEDNTQYDLYNFDDIYFDYNQMDSDLSQFGVSLIYNTSMVSDCVGIENYISNIESPDVPTVTGGTGSITPTENTLEIDFTQFATCPVDITIPWIGPILDWQFNIDVFGFVSTTIQPFSALDCPLDVLFDYMYAINYKVENGTQFLGVNWSDPALDFGNIEADYLDTDDDKTKNKPGNIILVLLTVSLLFSSFTGVKKSSNNNPE